MLNRINWVMTDLLGLGINLARIGLILLGAWISLRFIGIFLKKMFASKTDPKRYVSEPQMKTLGSLLQSITRYVIYFIAGIMILEELGVKTSSLLAGAGILGLAVGFGAQNLIRDIISGFFIIFEHQFTVGDYIEAAGVKGKVEEVGLRITKLRDWGGEVHLIPNGEINRVTNHARGIMRALVEVRVAYEEDLDRIFKILQEVCQEVARDFPVIKEGPDVLGIVDLGESTVLIRIVAHTQPFEQWGVERELRKRIKQTFDREGIRFPYPRRVVLGSDQSRELRSGVTESGGDFA